MIIKAISSVEGARAIDGGLIIVLEMRDGGDESVRVLLPVDAIEKTLAVLGAAAEHATELRAIGPERRGSSG